MDMESIPGQLDALRIRHVVLTERISDLQTGFHTLREGQVTLAAQLEANTEITKEIKDLVTAGRVTKKIAVWVTAVLVAVTTVWASVKSVIHTINS
jgi:hypothetical protein